MPARRWAFLAVVSVAASSMLGAQSSQLREVSDSPSCPRCRIQLHKIATLGSAGDSVSPDIMASVATDSRGNYYVGPVDTPGAVLIYGARGKIIGSVGRFGKGPGEHMSVGTVKVGRGDTLYVYDAGTWRLSVYTPSRVLVRSVQLPSRAHIRDFHPLPGGQVLIAGSVSSGPGAGRPLHVVSAGGTILRSFGTQVPPLERDGPLEQPATALTPDGRVWHTAENRYQLERWTPAGQRDQILIRRTRWFAPYPLEKAAPDIQTAPPKPTIRRILQESDTLLWVQLHVSATDWKQTWSGDPRRAPPITSLDTYLGFFDTILEVINPATGQLVVSQRVKEPLQRFFGENLTFTHREDTDGYRYVDIWQVALVAPAPTTR